MKDAVLFFVKCPEPGKVKTRLARTIGAEKAAHAYRMVAEANVLVLRELCDQGVRVIVAYDPPERESEIRRWLPREFDFYPQAGGDLGARLADAFDFAFASGAERVLALGSDTIGLSTACLHDGFRGLLEADVVLGPAQDGGYYVIGLKEIQFGLFNDIPWSTSGVLATTLERVKSNALSYRCLEELEDLDEVSNLTGREPNL